MHGDELIKMKYICFCSQTKEGRLPQRKQLARSTENLSVSICILLGQEV